MKITFNLFVLLVFPASVGLARRAAPSGKRRPPFGLPLPRPPYCGGGRLRLLEAPARTSTARHGAARRVRRATRS